MSTNNISVGLDIGTTKIAALVGRKNEHGKLEIIGLGYAPSEGVSRGMVTNLTRTTSDKLLRKAERLARLHHLIRTLGPESAFKRGFSITTDTQGKILRSTTTLKPGQKIRTKLIDGEITSTIQP